MKKYFLLFVIILIFVPIANADQFNPQDIGRLKADLEISSYLYSSENLDEINHSLYVIPENYQYLDVIGPDKYFIEEDDENKKIILQWKNFNSGNYKIKFRIINNAKFSNVQRIKYPYNAPKKYWKYLEGTDSVIITNDIRNTANKLALESGDSFEVISKISSWVYSNVKYDLNYSNVSLSSDDVYKYKRGTCDEFTTLFLAMTRSVGIPAKYISGITYNEGRWGYHAWAEVYIGGWVPVDPTWNEVGWLDASHIKFGEFLDADGVKIKTNYISPENSVVTTQDSSVKVDVLDTSPIRDVISLKNEVYPSEINPKNSAVLEVNVENKKNGCLVVPLKIVSRVYNSGSPIILISPPEKNLIVCPGEVSKYDFLIKPDSNLKKNYIYYNLADIYTPFLEKSTINLKINPNEKRDSSLILKLSTQTAEVGDLIKYDVLSDSQYRIYSDLPLEENNIVANKKGVHYFIVANEYGKVIKREIDVKNELNFKIMDVDIPPVVHCGDDFNISLIIKNYNENMFNIKIDSSNDIENLDDVRKIIPKNQSKKIIFYTKVFENCTGEDQYVNIAINDQKIYQKIKTEKDVSPISSLFDRLLRIIMILLSKIKSIQ